MSETTRARIYLGIVGTVPLLTFYGLVAEQAAPLWIGAAAAWLGTGLAALNTSPTKGQ